MPPNNLTRTQSVVLTPEKRLTALMLKALIFIEGLTADGLNQLANIYLVAIVGWTPLTASFVWIVREIIRIIYQPLLGDVVDRVKIHKYTILVAVAILKIVSGVCMLAGNAKLGVMIFKSVVDGVADSSFLPAVTGMTLGVVGKNRFHRKVAASNEIAKFLGVSIGTIVFGFVSYAIWPNVEKTFWILVAGGLMMLLCIIFVFKEVGGSDAVDHRLARGRSVWLINMSQNQSVQNLTNALVDLESDNEDDEGTELVSRRAKVEQEKGEEETGELSVPVIPDELGYTQVMTYRQMYSDPERRQSLIFMSLMYFTYHIANSTTAPLLGQYMAINAENGRDGLPIMSGLILTNSLSKVVTTWALRNDRASKLGYNKVLLIGSAALFLRLVLISVLVRYYDNFWALGATQVLDGVGGGCMGLMLLLYSHLLSRRTGHYNLNLAIVNAWKLLGSLFGVIIGGAIATEKTYELVFPILAGVAVLPAVLSFGVSTSGLKRLD